VALTDSDLSDLLAALKAGRDDRHHPHQLGVEPPAIDRPKQRRSSAPHRTNASRHAWRSATGTVLGCCRRRLGIWSWRSPSFLRAASSLPDHAMGL